MSKEMVYPPSSLTKRRIYFLLGQRWRSFLPWKLHDLCGSGMKTLHKRKLHISCWWVRKWPFRLPPSLQKDLFSSWTETEILPSLEAPCPLWRRNENAPKEEASCLLLVSMEKGYSPSSFIERRMYFLLGQRWSSFLHWKLHVLCGAGMKTLHKRKLHISCWWARKRVYPPLTINKKQNLK